MKFNDMYRFLLKDYDKPDSEYESIKAILLSLLIEKNFPDKTFVRVYTEYPISDFHHCSIYMDNIKSKKAISYEIHKTLSQPLKSELNEVYNEWSVPFMETEVIYIDISTLPKDITELTNKLREYLR